MAAAPHAAGPAYRPARLDAVRGREAHRECRQAAEVERWPPLELVLRNRESHVREAVEQYLDGRLRHDLGELWRRVRASVVARAEREVGVIAARVAVDAGPYVRVGVGAGQPDDDYVTGSDGPAAELGVPGRQRPGTGFT